MKSALLILGFIIYSVWLFWVSNVWLLGVMLALEISILIILPDIRWRTAFKFFLKNCGFVLFVILCNLLFSDWWQALLVGLRLGLAIEATYIISLLLSTREFAQGIATLCTPLKLLRVDTEELALSITVALTFVPLLAHEAKQLQSNLKLKGCGWKNLWRQPQVYVVGIVEQLFDYAEAAEQALRLKGYD